MRRLATSNRSVVTAAKLVYSTWKITVASCGGGHSRSPLRFARHRRLTNRLITGLMEQALTERAASRTHGRIIEITLTADGRARLLKAHTIVAEIEDDM